MKYADIVGLDKHFDPVFELLDGDKSASWATFIPSVDPFEELLREAIDAFESLKPQEQWPVWVQGTYGTGKSHAASVVSHLFHDDVDGLEPFLARMKPELASRIRSFRQAQRIVPVYLYGVGDSLLHSARTFNLAVQKAVKTGLMELGLRVKVPDDFDRFIESIEKNPLKIDWDAMIRGDSTLTAYAPSGVAELLRKLKAQDREVLVALEDYFADKGRAVIGTTSLYKWLKQVLDTSLTDGSSYTRVMIYWDEFTSVLELTRAQDIAAALQELAEFCHSEPRLKLLIISHRKPGQFALDSEEQKKMADRFKMVDYRMTDVTAYKILSAAILRKDKKAYEGLVSHAYSGHDELDKLVSRLDAGGAGGMRDDIRELFPIHPYTAYLAMFISRHIGSSDRSIFKFLNDEKKGFKRFIAENPDGGQVWLTSDALWDYFSPTLATGEPERFFAVSTTYNQRRAVVEARGSACTMVFKSMLLLNFLYSHLGHSDDLETTQLTPTRDNCEAMYAGTGLENHVEGELQFLEEQGALHRMGSEYLVISGAALPEDEVRKEVARLEASYVENVTSLLNEDQTSDLEGKYCGSSVLREVQVHFFNGGPHATSFHRKTAEQLGFGNNAALHVAVILYAKDDDQIGATEQLTDYSRRATEVDPALVILEALSPLGSRKLQDLANHRGRAVVADQHSLAKIKSGYDKMADMIVANWVQSLSSGQYNLYLRGVQTPIGCSVLPAALQDCSKRIFKNGFDDIQGVPKTCWHGGGRNIAERVLQAELLDDLVRQLAGQQKAVLNAFKSGSGASYVVTQNLEQTPQAAQVPIGRLSQAVREALQPMAKKVASFNLGDSLQDLARTPYGLYENLLHSAALAYALRPYLNRLYDSSGRRVGVLPMREVVVNLFKYWSNRGGRESLEVQFGTETEEHLVQILRGVFGLSDVGTLMDARSQLRTWVDQRHRPLWSVKYTSIASAVSSAVDALSTLLEMTQDDMSEDEMRRLVEAVDPVSAELKLLLDENRLKLGFLGWLSQFVVPVPNTDLAQQLYDELRGRMAGSPSVWSEETAREKMLDMLRPMPIDEQTSTAAAKVSEILDLAPSKDLVMVQLAGRETVRSRKYPLFAGALAAPTPALHDAVEAIQEFLQAASVDQVDASSLVKAIEEAGVDRVRHAMAAETLESALGNWVAGQLGVAQSSETTAAAYQSLLVGTSDPSLCKEVDACVALRSYPPDIPPPEDFKEKIRKRVLSRPVAEAQKLVVQMADGTPNGWAVLGQLLGEELDGQANR